MDYREYIAKAVEYIEQNLTNEINITDCARACGYSEYHFVRVFKEVSGLAPADYIRKRRLSEIAKQISQTDKFVSEIAFSYGFNSKENFTRAFMAEYHILPTEYRHAKNSIKIYEPLSFKAKPFHVVPEIITINSFYLTVYKSDENFPPNFWNKYNAKKLSLRLSGGKTCDDFGVSDWNSLENKLDYYIGIETDKAAGNVSGTQKIHIKGGLYALFQTPNTSHDGFINTIHHTWDYINTVWLPRSGYKRLACYEFESYIEQSRIFSEKIYIPIELK